MHERLLSPIVVVEVMVGQHIDFVTIERKAHYIARGQRIVIVVV